MERDAFEQLIAEEFPHAIPEKFRSVIKNVAFLVQNAPSDQIRKEEGLRENETLLGLYRGIPATARGDIYGVGNVLPDSIVLFQAPIVYEAENLTRGDPSKFEVMIRKVIRDTIWHEVAHHFGYDEHQVRNREQERNLKK
jgi:predicted Zn-dependent protease with MMP-like domain